MYVPHTLLNDLININITWYTYYLLSGSRHSGDSIPLELLCLRKDVKVSEAAMRAPSTKHNVNAQQHGSRHSAVHYTQLEKLI